MSNNQNTFSPFLPVVDRSTLPSDIDVLKDMVCEYAAVIEGQTVIIKDQMVAISSLTERVNQLDERYLKLARLHFGQSSEKLSTVREKTLPPSDPLAESPSNESPTAANAVNTNVTDPKKKQKNRVT